MKLLIVYNDGKVNEKVHVKNVYTKEYRLYIQYNDSRFNHSIDLKEVNHFTLNIFN